MKNLPSFLKRYFWDVDFEQIDVKKQSKDIIGRILEYGDEQATRWMKKKFATQEIVDVLSRYRFVSPKSANYWALVFNLPREQILCLQKHYMATQRKHWPY